MTPDDVVIEEYSEIVISILIPVLLIMLAVGIYRQFIKSKPKAVE